MYVPPHFKGGAPRSQEFLHDTVLSQMEARRAIRRLLMTSIRTREFKSPATSQHKEMFRGNKRSES